MPLSEYETVEAWCNGLREQWGEEPDMTQRLGVLERFCAFAGKDPDAIIAECTRHVESGKRIRIKARREYTQKITEFQEAEGGDARAQARTGNTLRSFFIYNGIFMQAGLQ
jgi:hypothetical protein